MDPAKSGRARQDSNLWPSAPEAQETRLLGAAFSRLPQSFRPDLIIHTTQGNPGLVRIVSRLSVRVPLESRRMVRLNGWRRLWAMVVVVWGGLVGLYTWLEWPQQSERRIRSYTFSDSSKGELVVRWYGEEQPPKGVVDALSSHDRRRPRPPAVPGDFTVSDLGHVYEFIRVARKIHQQPVAEAMTLEGVGLIHFPAGTSKAIRQVAVTEFVHGVWPRQREHLERSVPMFLLPALVLYAFGWLAGELLPHR